MSMDVNSQNPFSWVTLATNDKYAVGALVLSRSLRDVVTNYRIHILYTSNISPHLRDGLRDAFDDCTEVNILDSNDSENLALIGRPDLGETFTKLHCWRLTQYSKCVFLDADTLVLQNADELFENNEFSAAPDVGWPDYFNSGVFVFRPSIETYRNLLQLAVSGRSFDGGDQGLLNEYFSGWRVSEPSYRLPLIYNVTIGAIFAYPVAAKRNMQHIKIFHFTGQQKPWVHYSTADSGSILLDEFLKIWREKYRLIKENIPTQEVEEQVSSKIAPAPVDIKSDSESRYLAWEWGIIDYSGADSFENIQRVIDKSLEGNH